MKKTLITTLVVMLLTACIPTQIVTRYYPTTTSTATQVVAVRPTTTVVTTPTTTVSYPYTTSTTVVAKIPSQPKTTTTTIVTVNQYSNDLSFYLDLQAVAAAFAQSNTIEEFEMVLNSSSYLISNLDLNGDGMVDYLRVVEAMQGYNHVFVIQAVLAQNVFQDIASLVVEMDYTTPYVQVIGDPYIYGANYYLRPVFVQTPPLFKVFRTYGYTPWTSPYHWGYFPKHYGHPAPVVLSHYQACIHNFMSQHHYCHEVGYDDHCHYNGYSQMHQQVARNDYQQEHPQQAFAQRNSGLTSGTSGSGSTSTSVRNTRDLSNYVTASGASTTSSTSASRGTSTTSSTSASRGTSTTSTTSTTQGISGTRVSTTPATRATATDNTSLRSSGTSTTRSTTTTSSGTTTTVRRPSGVSTSTTSRTTTTSPSSATRGTSTSTSTTRGTSTSTSTTRGTSTTSGSRR